MVDVKEIQTDLTPERAVGVPAYVVSVIPTHTQVHGQDSIAI